MEMEGDEAGFSSWWLTEPSKQHRFRQPQSCIVRVCLHASVGLENARTVAGWAPRGFICLATQPLDVLVCRRLASPSGETSLEMRRWCKTPLWFHCSKPQTPQLATGEAALLCGRSDQHSNGQERRSGNAELRDCPLHSQEPCRFQTDNLGVNCKYACRRQEMGRLC